LQISGFSPSISTSFNRPQPQQAGVTAHDAKTNPATEETKANNKTETTTNNKETNAQPEKQTKPATQPDRAKRNTTATGARPRGTRP